MGAQEIETRNEAAYMIILIRILSSLSVLLISLEPGKGRLK